MHFCLVLFLEMTQGAEWRWAVLMGKNEAKALYAAAIQLRDDGSGGGHGTKRVGTCHRV